MGVSDRMLDSTPVIRAGPIFLYVEVTETPEAPLMPNVSLPSGFMPSYASELTGGGGSSGGAGHQVSRGGAVHLETQAKDIPRACDKWKEEF